MSFLHHLFLPRESNNWRARLLHPSLILVLIIYVVWSQQLISGVSNSFPQILGFASQIPPEQIISLTNAERQSRGLAPLKLNSDLSQAAQAKAGDMFARDYWAHVSPVGTQPWYFITQAGYTYRYAAENLARDFSDPASIVAAWVTSPSHRENLFSSKYQDIGVAVVDGKLGGRETTLVVQMFGTPLTSQPVVGGAASFTVGNGTSSETFHGGASLALRSFSRGGARHITIRRHQSHIFGHIGPDFGGPDHRHRSRRPPKNRPLDKQELGALHFSCYIIISRLIYLARPNTLI